jgi:ABC-type transporter Mla MlaB component
VAVDFEITETREAGYIRLTLRGDLDRSTSQILESRLRDLERAPLTVRLNLAQVEFADSGLSILIRAATRARESGRTYSPRLPSTRCGMRARASDSCTAWVA